MSGHGILHVLASELFDAVHGAHDIGRPIPDEWAVFGFDPRHYSELRRHYHNAREQNSGKGFWREQVHKHGECAAFFRLRFEFMTLKIAETLEKMAQIDPVWATLVVLIRDRALRIRVGMILAEKNCFPNWFKQENWMGVSK